MIQDWHYMDFKGKRIVRTIDAKSWFLPCNRAMERIMVQWFPDGCTFREFKQFLEDNKIIGGMCQFDGRSPDSVKYEPLQLTAKEFAYIVEKQQKDKYFGIASMLHEIGQLNKKIEQLMNMETDKRLVDIAIKELQNTLLILKKC